MASQEEHERWWLTSTTPEMLYILIDADLTVSPRKRVLFNAACCRRIWHLIKDERCRRAVELAEEKADGVPVAPRREKRVRKDLANACVAADYNKDILTYNVVFAVNTTLNHEWVEWDSAATFASSAYYQANPELDRAIQAQLREVNGPDEAAGIERQMESARQCELIRDIFGNPFHPVHVDRAWRTPAVVAIAQTIYDERCFSEMPVLADALEELGCTNEEMLNHCRGPGEHVRGCWVVDLITGKQ